MTDWKFFKYEKPPCNVEILVRVRSGFRVLFRGIHGDCDIYTIAGTDVMVKEEYLVKWKLIE